MICCCRQSGNHVDWCPLGVVLSIAVKRVLVLLWSVLCVGSLILGASGWPENIATWSTWAGDVGAEAWRWILVAFGLSATVRHLVRSVAAHVRKVRLAKSVELRYADYARASYMVHQYTKYVTEDARAGVQISTTYGMLQAFEKAHPEGVHKDGGYDGRLLESWIRYNAANLLTHNVRNMKPLPN